MSQVAKVEVADRGELQVTGVHPTFQATTVKLYYIYTRLLSFYQPWFVQLWFVFDGLYELLKILSKHTRIKEENPVFFILYFMSHIRAIYVFSHSPQTLANHFKCSNTDIRDLAIHLTRTMTPEGTTISKKYRETTEYKSHKCGQNRSYVSTYKQQKVRE